MKAHVDGSCRLKTRKGGWAVVFEDGTVKSGTEYNTTNNRMELTAAIIASVCGVDTVYSDSLYVINGIKSQIYDWRLKGKKKIPNADLWDYMKLVPHDHIEWVWIPREQNKLADKEAKKCSKEKDLTV